MEKKDIDEVKIFISDFGQETGQETSKERKMLLRHLASLRSYTYIQLTSEIAAGMDWAAERKSHLNKADIILFLVNSHFVRSYLEDKDEVDYAMRRRSRERITVIPILLAPANWKNIPLLNRLQGLPKEGTISILDDKETACLSIVKDIEKIADEILKKRQEREKQKQEHVKNARIHAQNGRQCKAYGEYKRALDEYEQAIRIDCEDPLLYDEKGDVLCEIERFLEALASYDEALKLTPREHSWPLWRKIGKTHLSIGQSKEMQELYTPEVSEQYKKAIEAYKLATPDCDSDALFLD